MPRRSKHSAENTVLTPLQQAFINAYIGEAHFNGTEAARRAGYTGSYATLRAVAYENLTKPYIAAEVKRRLSALNVGPEESLARTTKRARATLADFYRLERDKDGLVTYATFSIEEAFNNGAIHNAKRIKKGKYGWEVELSDPAAADQLLLRVHGLLKDAEQELTVEETLEELRRVADEFGHKLVPIAASALAAEIGAPGPPKFQVIVNYTADNSSTAPRSPGGDKG